MRIMQVVPSLRYGGAEVFALHLSNALSKINDNEVTLVTMFDYQPDMLPLTLISDKVKYISLGKKGGPDLSIIGKLQKLIEQIQPDVVHTHLHAGYYVLPTYLGIKGFSFKKVHTLHNLAKRESPKWLMRRVYNYFFKKQIIQAVAISEEALRTAQEEYGSANVTTLILNGTVAVTPTGKYDKVEQDVTALKKNKNTKVLVNIGRISTQKNHQLLLKCMKRLHEEGQNIIALVLGNMVPEEKQLYDEVMSMKPANVHFLGNVENPGDYLLQADAFVLSSIFEGMPISFLEALSAGVVTISTAVGGMKDNVSSEVGFLAGEADEQSFYAALKAFIHTDIETIKKMKQNARALYHSKFSMSSCAAAYNQLYLN